jgi:hypothetical protein
VFYFQPQEMRLAIDENPVPLNPPALDEVVVIPNQEKVSSIHKLPEA